MKRPFLSLAFAITLVFGVVVTVQAAGEGPPTRTIPFQGSLELDGSPVDGPTNLMVTLYDDAVADNVLFSEPHSVMAVAGKFSVVIGSQAALPDAVLNAAELFAGVAVEGVTLAGRQKIHAAARVMDPPEFRAGRIVSAEADIDVLDTTTHTTDVLNLEAQTPGLTGWRIAADIAGSNGAFRLNGGNVQLGLHNTGSVFISDTTGPSIRHPFEFQRSGDMAASGVVNAAGMRLGGGGLVTRVEAGTAGNCDGVSPGLGASPTIPFPGPAFTAPPIVTVVPAIYDNAGCTDARLREVGLTSFRIQTYTGDNVPFGCDCVHWIAVGR